MQVLKNGVILCKLMNKISPGAVPKFKEKGMPFILMENIQSFLVRFFVNEFLTIWWLWYYRTYYSLLSDFLILWLFQKAAKTYGVPDTEVFQTPDLFEARNVPQVQTMFLVKLSIDIITYSLLQTDISPRYCFLFFVGDVMHLLFGKNDSETPRVWWTNHGTKNGHRK